MDPDRDDLDGEEEGLFRVVEEDEPEPVDVFSPDGEALRSLARQFVEPIQVDCVTGTIVWPPSQRRPGGHVEWGPDPAA